MKDFTGGLLKREGEKTTPTAKHTEYDFKAS